MLTNELWVIVSVSCEKCGKDASVSLVPSKPTLEQIRANEVRIGAGGCVDSYIHQMKANGKPVVLEIFEEE